MVKKSRGTDRRWELDEQSTALLTRARERTAGFLKRAYLPRQKRVVLLVTDGPLKGTNFPITKAQVLIGRPNPDGSSEADVAIEDPQVSRKHCVLEIHGQSVLLVDLDSANGTYVSGKRIASCELTNLSEFQIGKSNLVIAIT